MCLGLQSQINNKQAVSKTREIMTNNHKVTKVISYIENINNLLFTAKIIDLIDIGWEIQPKIRGTETYLL